MAEPVNTFSFPVCFSFPPLLFFGLPWRLELRLQLAPRFVLRQLALAFVGFGSTALHATVSSKGTWGDELPMIYAATMLAYNAVFALLDSHPNWEGSRWWALATFRILPVSVTIAHAFLNDITANFGLVFFAYIATLRC